VVAYGKLNWARRGCGELGEAVVGLERMWRARKVCGGLGEAVES
jgi:hypothetical protein